MKLSSKIKASFKRKPKVVEEKPPDEAEQAQPKGESIDEKQ